MVECVHTNRLQGIRQVQVLQRDALGKGVVTDGHEVGVELDRLKT